MRFPCVALGAVLLFSSCAPPLLDDHAHRVLVKSARTLEQRRKAETGGRKDGMLDVRAEELPHALRDLGYQSALVDPDAVIMVKTHKDPLFAVIHHPDAVATLRKVGYRVKDTPYPDVKVVEITDTMLDSVVDTIMSFPTAPMD